MTDPNETRPGDTAPPPAVVVLADDPLTRDGTNAFMAAGGRVEVLPRERMAEADVVVVITPDVTGETLTTMSRASRVTGGRARLVLVADRVARSHLPHARGHGTVSFLARPYTSFTQLETAVLDSHRGAPARWAAATGAPRDAAPTARRAGTAPGLPTPDLAPREVDVLRLLAEGRDVTEIATELSYSERLIKSVIHSAVKRLGLRNRTQAVAHAIRTGIL
ncbi:response regulator transcription factor [Streptomyces ziwulingensis]|uniref:Response regulator transcription factor n=1 Tax=Streptomyces ziwulingensis TaxID=1045501 RepID=A0ABP9CCC8_9ACTN